MRPCRFSTDLAGSALSYTMDAKKPTPVASAGTPRKLSKKPLPNYRKLDCDPGKIE